MNNERYNQIIDEAYDNYNKYMTKNFMETRWCIVDISPDGTYITGHKCNRDEFISESKTQPGFSEKWGLKIEERELRAIERMEYYGRQYMKKDEIISVDEWLKVDYEGLNIPTKLITVYYKDEKIEVYE